MRAKTSLFIAMMACVSLLQAGTQIDRQWNFSSASTVQFTLQDTLTIKVHFPDAIPDDRLLGYTRFQISISDSTAGIALPGKKFAYRIRFDAGFLNFNHVITMDIKYRRGLLGQPAVSPAQYGVMIDPFPTSGLHEWFPAAPLTIDTILQVIRFSYTHKKFNPQSQIFSATRLQAIAPAIATSGYPFEFGLFVSDSNRAAIIRRPSSKPETGAAYSNTNGTGFTLSGKKATTYAPVNGSRKAAGLTLYRVEKNTDHGIKIITIQGFR